MTQAVENIEPNAVFIIVILVTIILGILGIVNIWKGNAKAAILLAFCMILTVGTGYVLLH